jgi:hypothetical protein
MTAAITCSSEISFPTNGVPETKITPRSFAPSFARSGFAIRGPPAASLTSGKRNIDSSRRRSANERIKGDGVQIPFLTSLRFAHCPVGAVGAHSVGCAFVAVTRLRSARKISLMLQDWRFTRESLCV